MELRRLNMSVFNAFTASSTGCVTGGRGVGKMAYTDSAGVKWKQRKITMIAKVRDFLSSCDSRHATWVNIGIFWSFCRRALPRCDIWDDLDAM